MPRDDADFAAYLAARWPAVVRTLELLGARRADADQAGRETFAQAWRAWDRLRREDDVDVQIYATALRAWRRQHGDDEPEPAPSPPPPDAEDRVLLLHALREQLRGLEAEHREVLVLRFVADLSEAQVADVLDLPESTVAARVVRAVAALDLDPLRDLTSG